MDRGLSERETLEVLRRDGRQTAGGLGLHAHSERAAGEHGDRSHPGGPGVMAHWLAPALGEDERLRATFEQKLQPGGLLALLGDDVARLHMTGTGKLHPLGQLGVAETVEQVDGAKLGQCDGLLGHSATCRGEGVEMVTPRPGIRGSGTQPSSPPPPHSPPA